MVFTMLTIIIPTLNAQATLSKTMATVHGSSIVVADGGSTDGTPGIARELGAEIIESAPGRGRQLAMGADRAIDDGATWLLFIHADSELSPNWSDSVAKFMAEPENNLQVAYFKLAFNDGGKNAIRAARRVAMLANWRAKNLGLPYGDQGLLISAKHYKKIGGFNSKMDLMEDVDMARRVGKKNMACLDATITTSPIRYLRDGWWARPVQNIVCLLLYYAGVNQATLKRIYK